MHVFSVGGVEYRMRAVESLDGLPVVVVGTLVLVRDSGDLETNRKIAITAVEKVRALPEKCTPA